MRSANKSLSDLSFGKRIDRRHDRIEPLVFHLQGETESYGNSKPSDQTTYGATKQFSTRVSAEIISFY